MVFEFVASGQFRNFGTRGSGVANTTRPWALSFGGGGGQASSFTLSVSEDITLNSHEGIGPLDSGNDCAVLDVPARA